MDGGWLSMGELMAAAYFHLVFTLPAEFRSLVSANQKLAYGVLFKAAAESLMQLAADERYLGAQIGILAVLHTWSRAMVYHPHVHLLVPGVGLSTPAICDILCISESNCWVILYRARMALRKRQKARRGNTVAVKA